ncbi:MAG: methyltransferase domain-containing protein [Anaerolineaceae bacterium]
MSNHFLRNLLAYPITDGLDLDDPKTTILRREIIQDKPFLRKIYEEWYQNIISSLPTGNGSIIELGSGGGFLEQLLPEVITSDISYFPHIKLVMNGLKLPFADSSLRAIVMVNVFHHLPSVRDFLHEASRCIMEGGAVIMIEPWLTAWSRGIYQNYHHETFSADTPVWEFASSGPLSGANGALPWIVFQRDREIFEREFPEWNIKIITPFMPFRYLLSGGVSMKSLMPGWSFPFWTGFEKCLNPNMNNLAMFVNIVINKFDQ